MPSHPAESLSQRQLVFELKHAIDVCQRRPYDQRAARHLAELLRKNPRGARSTHVRHNIGRARREWLSAEPARPHLVR